MSTICFSLPTSGYGSHNIDSAIVGSIVRIPLLHGLNRNDPSCKLHPLLSSPPSPPKQSLLYLQFHIPDLSSSSQRIPKSSRTAILQTTTSQDDDWLFPLARFILPPLSLIQLPTDTTTHPGIWLNVELSIGILSVSLPLMRPLVSRAIPSQIRSRFSKSRFSKSRKTGSYRLQDVEGPNAGISSNSRAPHSKGLSDSGVYQGQNKRQPYKSWYNAGTYISSKGDGRRSKEGSEEDIVPMGKIHVKHDLEQEQRHGSVSQKSGASDTLG